MTTQQKHTPWAMSEADSFVFREYGGKFTTEDRRIAYDAFLAGVDCALERDNLAAPALLAELHVLVDEMSIMGEYARPSVTRARAAIKAATEGE